MNIEKFISEANIKYFTGDICYIFDNKTITDIYDPSNKIYFMLDGSCSFILKKSDKTVTHVLSKDEMLLIPANMAHSIKLSYDPDKKPAEKYGLVFNLNLTV